MKKNAHCCGTSALANLNFYLSVFTCGIVLALGFCIWLMLSGVRNMSTKFCWIPMGVTKVTSPDIPPTKISAAKVQSPLNLPIRSIPSIPALGAFLVNIGQTNINRPRK